jgi:hypothetical protein
MRERIGHLQRYPSTGTERKLVSKWWLTKSEPKMRKYFFVEQVARTRTVLSPDELKSHFRSSAYARANTAPV